MLGTQHINIDELRQVQKERTDYMRKNKEEWETLESFHI